MDSILKMERLSEQASDLVCSNSQVLNFDPLEKQKVEAALKDAQADLVRLQNMDNALRVKLDKQEEKLQDAQRRFEAKKKELNELRMKKC